MAERTDAMGGKHAYGYDARGRIVETTDPNEGITRLAYDADGHLTHVTDPADGEAVYTVDAHGLVTELRTPAVRVRRVLREEAGRPAAVTAGDVKALRYWDEAGLVRGETRPDGVRLRYAYDAPGRLAPAASQVWDPN